METSIQTLAINPSKTFCQKLEKFINIMQNPERSIRIDTEMIITDLQDKTKKAYISITIASDNSLKSMEVVKFTTPSTSVNTVMKAMEKFNNSKSFAYTQGKNQELYQEIIQHLLNETEI